MKKNSTITFVLIKININIVSLPTNKKLQYLFLMKTMVENICSSEKNIMELLLINHLKEKILCRTHIRSQSSFIWRSIQQNMLFTNARNNHSVCQAL